LRRLKKALQNNLSPSSKLFLRGLLRIVQPRNRRPPVLCWEAPPPAGSALNALLLAEPKPAGQHVPGNIRASIIIPVCNKAEFTFQCIRSLVAEIDFKENEVIVVDNASTDQTKQVLTHFENVLRVVSNKEDRGFVDACNQGAAVARGRYLLFLNNDTVVLPGWLNHLVETIAGNPEIGAVGSMILYHGGSIQEAGAIVWKSGEVDHYGRGALPDDHRFNFAREVDCCSGVSSLVRKEIFESLGGFDHRFGPADYQDVDLCFGVRSLGYKVVYQPMSRLVHFDGVTTGGDTAKGIKQVKLNQEKFVDKWRAVLEREQLAKNLEQLPDASDRNRDRNRIIVFDERIPSPDRDAGSLRMFLILKALVKWCHVIFVPFNRPQSLDYERSLWKEGIETADAVDYRQLLKRKNTVAAIVSRPTMATAFIHRIRRVSPKARIVFDMVDTHFVRLQREHQISGAAATLAAAQRYRKLEKRLAQASDIVWCASAEDKQVMQAEVPEKRIEVIPTIHELRDRGKPFGEREGLLFIGNFDHRPNNDALLFFMREVYPLLLHTLPDVELDIVGGNPSDALAAFNSSSVRIRGYVPDVEPFLRDRRVFIAPLRFGAGIKGKVGEAMAYGIPVVTTSIGAEGFGLTHELDVMIADDPASFAAAVEQLYSQRELWERIAENSQRRIEQHFTPEIIAETIKRSLQDVSQS